MISASSMVETLVAVLACGTVFAAHQGIQTVLRLAIEVEEEESSRTNDINRRTNVISELRSLRLITSCIFSAFLPVSGVLLGSILPDPIRAYLKSVLGPVNIIAISVAVVFAYIAAFRALSHVQGPRIWAALKRLLGGVPPLTPTSPTSGSLSPPLPRPRRPTGASQ